MQEIRLLRADEIDARISICNQWGVGILLYKDARCDMNILDETFGNMNWQRKHELIDGQLFCSVGVRDGEGAEWVWKQDVGVESYTEKEKGRASDSFKRACFNIGIGRELYTAPNMFVRSNDLKTLKEDDRGRWTCKDIFTVTSIQYVDRKICYVAIRNEKTGKIIEFGQPAEAEKQKVKIATEKQVMALRNTIKKKELNENEILDKMGIPDWNTVTAEQYNAIVQLIRSTD